MAVGASLALALIVTSAMAKDAFKSGPQIGDRVGIPFDPLHCNGPSAGKKACQV